MGNCGIDRRDELVFRFLLGEQDVVCNIVDLQNPFDLPVFTVFIDLKLDELVFLTFLLDTEND
jgi:hypothetical protein